MPSALPRHAGTALAFLLLSLLAVLLYWPALHAPWYFDDMGAIVENPAIRDLRGALSGLFGRRGLAMASFALNYHFGGLDPFGYHLVNLAVHLGSAWLAFLLLRRVFPGDRVMAFAGAAIFLVHPLQTQPVNYIVQRMTLLSGGFFLAALYLVVRAREILAEGGGWRAPAHLWCYGGALLAGLLALLAKETAVVLPAALLLFSRFFLPGELHWRPLLVYLAPFCLAPLAVAGLYLLLPLAAGTPLVELTAVDRIASQREITPLAYLVTEFSVLWCYLRMLLLPYGQALDHSYPVAERLLTLTSSLAFLGLAALGGLAWRLRRQSPLIAFGIAWFFLSLAVESTLLPLDPLFEHRLYLTVFGFAVAVLGGCRLLPRRGATAVLALMLAVLAVLTWQRNRLWADPVALYTDNLRKAPHSERVRVNLALHAMRGGRTGEAERLLREALAINPHHDAHYINLSKLLVDQRRYQEALATLHEGLAIAPDSVKLLNNLGGLYNLLGRPERAIESLQQALRIDPRHASALTNLGVVYGGMGLWREAEGYHRRSIDAFGDDPIAHFNLGLVLERQGRLAEAVPAYRQAVRLKADDADALLHLARVSLRLGDRPTAVAILPRLQTISPGHAAKLANALGAGAGG